MPPDHAPKLISIFDELSDIMKRKGELFKYRAYQKAIEGIMLVKEPLSNPIEQLKGISGIGPVISKKISEYMNSDDGLIKILRVERANPVNLLTTIHGIGPKKADELVKSGIESILQLRQSLETNPSILNDIQKMGLKYYDATQRRIPRDEIDLVDEYIHSVVGNIPNIKHEIVGSYRRGATNSGDIDIILTNTDTTDPSVMVRLMDKMIDDGFIIDILSRGKTKSMVMAGLPNYPPRRVDFMYSKPDEFAFAILYFTGSKIFNMVMRHRALALGYSMNEHEIVRIDGKKKGDKIDHTFPDEESIFKFLGLAPKLPSERTDGSAVVVTDEIPRYSVATIHSTDTTDPTFSISESIIKFRSNGIGYIESLSEHNVSQIIREANTNYYNSTNDESDPRLLSDNEFDVLKEYMERIYPTNPVLREIGAPITKGKVLLPENMPSMNKIKPTTGALQSWLLDYSGPYCITPKMDGVSGMYVVDEFGKSSMFTRGDGKYGQNVSHLIPFMNLPKKPQMIIRGEFEITRHKFSTKYTDKFKNARNFVSGVINQKTRDPEKYSDVDFVAYETIHPHMKPSEQFIFLEMHDIPHVPHVLVDTLTNEDLSKRLLEIRANHIYDTDGLVVANDALYERTPENPKHSFAFKQVLSDQTAEVKVLGVEWTPSKDGMLKPVVHIEPVTLSGVKIEYVTGFNAKFIRDNRIGVGALITVVRSGDVIPHIMGVVEPAEYPMMPTVDYIESASGVDAIIVNIETNPIVLLKRVTGFFRGIEVDGMGPGNVKRILATNDGQFNSIAKIIHMTVDDFLMVDGFKTTIATKLHSNIRSALDRTDISIIMPATNLFGRGVGTRTIRAIMKKYPNILVSGDNDTAKIYMITSIDGIELKTAEKFVAGIDPFIEFMKEAGLFDRFVGSENTDLGAPAAHTNVSQNHPLYGKRIVFTGFRDKVLSSRLELLGIDIVPSIGKNTYMVVVKNPDDVLTLSDKVAKAKDMGIRIMDKATFVAKFVSDQVADDTVVIDTMEDKMV